MIVLKPELRGTILDIGGGGEGIIGRLYGAQVIAIDNRQEELDEAPNGFEKVLMDACCIDYPDEKFDHATFFYSLMFMNTETQRKAISEASRVLKKGGCLHIWDAEIHSAYLEPFIVDLDIQIKSEFLHTTFGVVSDIQNQTAASVSDICSKYGLILKMQNVNDGQFHIVFEKPNTMRF